jgi:hypothetical protein
MVLDGAVVLPGRFAADAPYAATSQAQIRRRGE